MVRCHILASDEIAPIQVEQFTFQKIGGLSHFEKQLSAFSFLSAHWRAGIIPTHNIQHDPKNNIISNLFCIMGALIENPMLKQSTEVAEEKQLYTHEDFSRFLTKWEQPLVLIGPPGTGKTTVISEQIKSALDSEKQLFIIAYSTTYNALYTVLKKVINNNILQKGEAYIIVSRSGTPFPEEIKDYIVKREDLAKLKKNKVRLLRTTPMNAQSTMFAIPTNRPTLPIIDEASKIPVIEYLYIMQAITHSSEGHNLGYMFYPPVLVGDDQQLEPFQAAKGFNLSSVSTLSLFINMAPSMRNLRFLTTCHRFSNPALSIVQKMFYNDLPIAEGNPTKKTAMEWNHVQSSYFEQQGSSKNNTPEMQAIRNTLGEYSRKTVAVISPYQAQIDLFKHQHRCDIDNVEYLTIDSVQGRDFDIVLLSLVDSNCPFVNQRNRLNVTVTRGKEKTIISGKQPSQGTLLYALYHEIQQQQFLTLPAGATAAALVERFPALPSAASAAVASSGGGAVSYVNQFPTPSELLASAPAAPAVAAEPAGGVEIPQATPPTWDECYESP